MILSAIWMALVEIRRNGGRSFLTALGIVIGVAAVIATITLGDSATKKVTNDVAALGNNMVMLTPGNMRRGPVAAAATPFRASDVAAVEREIVGLAAVAPTSSTAALVVYGSKNHSTQIMGSTNAYFDVRGWQIAAGRRFSEGEVLGAAPACVLGATPAKELFGNGSPIGATIRVGKMSCTVVGLTVAKGKSTFGQDQDDYLLVPLATFQRRIAGNKDVGQIMMSVGGKRPTAAVVRQIQSLMRERRRILPGSEDDFDVRDMAEISSALGSVTSTLTALLGAIAAVSLLVGGIGIMNIMLVSVTERTREIGIRLAVGARAVEVLTHFLVEAAVLSLFGGTIGIGLGLGGSWLATRLFGLPFVVSPSVVLLAFGFSATIGVVFGFLPARRAARLVPTEALRHE